MTVSIERIQMTKPPQQPMKVFVRSDINSLPSFAADWGTTCGGRSFFSKTCSKTLWVTPGWVAEGLGDALCLFAVGGGGDTARFLLCVFISASVHLYLVRGRLCIVELNLQVHFKRESEARAAPHRIHEKKANFTNPGIEIGTGKKK
jgi:hypothetical protein